MGNGGTPGAGGVGIRGSGLTIFNNGAVSGGVDSNGVQANAITFTGGANYLELRPGFAINGDAVVQSGAGTLALGGSGVQTFNVSGIGDTGFSAQYQGFGAFVKTGASR